ncbi:hypothetical protein ACS0TY_014727 [Phlomoides rotata]
MIPAQNQVVFQPSLTYNMIFNYKLSSCYFPEQQVQDFGDPFFLVIHEGETLAEVKVRIQKKLQVPDEEFSKWKFAFLSLGRPEYLEDSDIVSSRFQRRDVYGAWEQSFIELLDIGHATMTYMVI